MSDILSNILGGVMLLALGVTGWLFLAAVTGTLPERKQCRHDLVVEFGPAAGNCARCGVRVVGRL